MYKISLRDLECHSFNLNIELTDSVFKLLGLSLELLILV